jgi:hypothetical protein
VLKLCVLLIECICVFRMVLKINRDCFPNQHLEVDICSGDATVSRPVCLGIKHPSGLTTRFLLLSDRCGFVDVERSLWRADESVVYNCCWPSPAQSFSGQSPLGHATIFDCFRFETSLFVASYDSQGYSGGIRPRHHMELFPIEYELNFILWHDAWKTE